MGTSRYAEDRWFFIEKTQDWFLRKNHFWLLLSILAFASVLTLQVLLIFASYASPSARQQSEFLVLPLLGLFVLSVFWRSIVQFFLSCTGCLLTYGGVFLFHVRDATTQAVVPYVANRLGYGIKHLAVISPDSVADRYFIVGMFAMAFCLAMAIWPKFFKSRNPDDLPYPVWRHSNAFVTSQKTSLTRLIPVSVLLSYEESHMVAKYKYVVVAIAGTRYLVTPYDWIPEGSVLIRDDETNSFIGIL
ncbi:MAG TPA: hypothetical protein VJ792_00170 [Candidatus Nitrosotalea sp.]|nr:hypothetical protein [Candidatus Nitrosotalea sp.]